MSEFKFHAPDQHREKAWVKSIDEYKELYDRSIESEALPLTTASGATSKAIRLVLKVPSALRALRSKCFNSWNPIFRGPPETLSRPWGFEIGPAKRPEMFREPASRG